MNKLDNTQNFIIFCLELYRTENAFTKNKVFNTFKKYNVFEYLKSGYEVLHTQSAQYIFSEISDYIKSRNETLSR